VVAAIWLISVSRASGTARRVLGRRRGLATLRAGVFCLGEVAVGDGVVVEAAKSGDEVLGRAAPAAGVAAGDDVRLDVLGQLLDVRWFWFVQPSVTPLIQDAVPVGAVHPAGAVADGGGNDGDVLGERWRGRPVRCCPQQLAGGDAHPR